MAEERLSKLQKWIVTECFKVTVLLDRTELKKLENYNCSNFNVIECPKIIKKERNQNNAIIHACPEHCYCGAFNFYKEDILLSYFNLEIRTDKYTDIKHQHFRYTEKNNKAYVTLHRSLENLEKKEIIWAWKPYKDSSLRMELTDKGIDIALSLLNLDRNVIVEPELLTPEQCEEVRKADEAKERAFLRMIQG